MKINFKKTKKMFEKNQAEINLAEFELEEKLSNQTNLELHTMLMKADFENYLASNENLISNLLKDEQADLADFQSYEKELAKKSGCKKR